MSTFLGIHIKKIGKDEFVPTQSGLIDKVFAVTGLSDCNRLDTPASLDPLHTNKDGSPLDEAWAYNTIIGMLMYFARNTRLDIACRVHRAANLIHCA